VMTSDLYLLIVFCRGAFEVFCVIEFSRPVLRVVSWIFPYFYREVESFNI